MLQPTVPSDSTFLKTKSSSRPPESIMARITQEKSPCSSCGSQSSVLRVGGPAGSEVWALLRPSERAPRRNLERQIADLRAQQQELLGGIGSGLAAANEIWFLSEKADPQRLGPTADGESHRLPPSAVTAVRQPPCCDRCSCLLQWHLVLGEERENARRASCIWDGVYRSDEPRASGHCTVDGEGNRHIRLANILAPSADLPFEEECHEMFERGQATLQQLGASFQNVVRTWIYLRHIDRDYATLNRVRCGFFERVGVELYPASTGIGGAPIVDGRDSSLSLYAIVPGGHPPRLARMHSSTFNEALDYGSLFSRGIQIPIGRSRTLLLSGTAAVDQNGRSVGKGDLSTQTRRMLENLQGLLSQAGADFSHAVQAVSYLKRGSDCRAYRALIEGTGLLEIPHAVVEADVCRSELLCELELTAYL